MLVEAIADACGKLPRWTCPNDRTICTVSANSANRAPAFNFALNHCITKTRHDAVLTDSLRHYSGCEK